MKVIQNPDEDFVRDMKKQLKENNGYCPCSIVKSNDTKCRCKAFRDQLSMGEPGACHCGLWIAVEDSSR